LALGQWETQVTFQPDGRANKARIGVIVPHMEVVAESEFAALAPPGVTVHTARVPLGPVGSRQTGGKVDPFDIVRGFANRPDVDRAAMMLGAAPIDVVVFAFTSSSYLNGAEGDAALRRRLEEATGGAPVVVQGTATVAALRAVGAKRLVLVHPPWWPPALDEASAAFFEGQGFEVASSSRAPIESAQGEVDARELADWVAGHVTDQADTVFFGGSGLRTIGIIADLEERLALSVVSANQAAFWLASSLIGAPQPSMRYGRLFGAATGELATYL
jgi:maleate isomerase